MADLTREQVKALGLAVGIEIDEPILTDVTHDLNALKETLEGVNPPGLDQIEPLPIIGPHRGSAHGQE